MLNLVSWHFLTPATWKVKYLEGVEAWALVLVLKGLCWAQAAERLPLGSDSLQRTYSCLMPFPTQAALQLCLRCCRETLESTRNSSCGNTHEVAVKSLSRVWLFVTPCAARQASLSFTISRSLLKLMSMESVMPSSQEPTHWKRPWCWERLRAGGEGDDRGWDGWIHMIMTQYYISRNSAPQDSGWPIKLLRLPQKGSTSLSHDRCHNSLWNWTRGYTEAECLGPRGER